MKGSEEFENFLHCLGDTIELKGWTGYRGGLDVAGKWLSSSRWVLRFESFVFPTLTELQSFPSKNDVQHMICKMFIVQTLPWPCLGNCMAWKIFTLQTLPWLCLGNCITCKSFALQTPPWPCLGNCMTCNRFTVQTLPWPCLGNCTTCKRFTVQTLPWPCLGNCMTWMLR